MIQAAFSAGLVARLGGRHTAATARPATVVRAVRLAAVTRDTDRKQLVTGVAGLLAKRGVHGAAGNDCRGHWTPVPIRGTTEGDYLVVPRSSRWSRGPGGSVRVPTSSRSPQRTSARRARPRLGLRRSGRVAHSTGGRPGLFEATSPVRFKPPPSSASLGTTAPASRPAPSTEIQISALIPARPQEFRGLTIGVHPRRLTIAPAGVGCSAMLGRWFVSARLSQPFGTAVPEVRECHAIDEEEPEASDEQG